MADHTNHWTASALEWWILQIQRAPLAVLVISLLAAGGLTGYAVKHLGVDTDTEDMLSEKLDWRQDFRRYKAEFPHTLDTILIVVDSRIPEQAEIAAAELVARMRAQPDLFRRVEWLAGSDFFRRHGLLYRSPEALADMTDRLAQVQPVLMRMAREPNLTGLKNLFELALGEAGDDGIGEDLSEELDAFMRRLVPAVEAAADGASKPLSWRLDESGNGGAVGDDFQLIVVDPKLDYGRLLAAQEPIARIREMAAQLEELAGEGIRVRLTGPAPVRYEELRSVGQGAALAVVAALIVVALILFVGLRSGRLILVSLVTLLAGLGATAGFAALAVGNLNLISVAFAVLYIGLGIDFSIHYCLRYRELVLHGEPSAQALVRAARDVGVSLVVCAVTTSVGFFAFIPTDFKGVAELGLISGVGMYISLAATFTILPATLSLLPLKANAAPAPPSGASRVVLAAPQYHFRVVIVLALVLGVGAAYMVPRLGFDSNVMNLRNPESESVRTFFDLVEHAPNPPVGLSVLVEDLQSASRVQQALEGLDVVSHTLSLANFVPPDQAEKLELIEEMRWIMGPSIAVDPAPPERERQRAGLADLIGILEVSADRPAARELAAALNRFSERLEPPPEGDDQRLLERLQDNLFSFLPASLETLDRALEAAPITGADLPAELVENWVGVDGRFRVEIYPAENVFELDAQARFVETVAREVDGATGVPLINYRAGLSVQAAFRQALLLAAVVIAVLLLVLMRSVVYPVIVLIPLGLAAVMTAGIAAASGMSLTFANVIALPLLLGVGVDSGIHMVHRIRSAPPESGSLLGTSTARAVLFSGLTTTFSFGNLALSAHPGTASMGTLLVIGMVCMLFTTLVVLPALLAALANHRLRQFGS